MTNTNTELRARKPRGQYAKTEAKRTAILEAALEVFSESGYRSGSLRDIATRVGTSDAGLLHHFPSKTALLQAVLDHRQQRDRTFTDIGAQDGRVALRGVVALAAHNAETPGVVELYATLAAEATTPDHPAHAHFVQRYESVREAGIGIFERLHQEGRLRPGLTPARAGVLTIAVMDGLQLQWLLDRESVDMAVELQAFLESIVDFGDDWSWEEEAPQA